MHETSDKDRAYFLKNMLFSIKMEEFDSLQDNLMKINDTQDQLKSIERKMKEKDVVVITLKSLPAFYGNFIETLNIIIIDKYLLFVLATR